MKPISLYLHIPFCQKRCHYCDFTTYAGVLYLIPHYVDALIREIRQVANSLNEVLDVHTIFFGGGTPSLLSTQQLDRILGELWDGFKITNDAEISLEANPGTVSLESLKKLRSAGFNRISFGVQSFRSSELVMMGRIHNVGEARKAILWAKEVGFSNINLDLIFGLPGQTNIDWEMTLDQALGLNPSHLSLYALTIEEGTPFHGWMNRGLLETINDDLSAEMYELASDRLETEGFLQYEISNWARPGKECRHNLQYWRMRPYLGLGVGAHGYINRIRTANTNLIPDYIRRMKRAEEQEFPFSLANESRNKLSLEEEMAEFMMVGFRLVGEGVSAIEFEERFGQPMDELFGGQIQKLLSRKLIENVPGSSDRWRLTKAGRLLGNQVFIEFV